MLYTLVLYIKSRFLFAMRERMLNEGDIQKKHKKKQEWAK